MVLSGTSGATGTFVPLDISGPGFFEFTNLEASPSTVGSSPVIINDEGIN